MRSSVMVTKNMPPKMHASRHWPVMKLENVRWLRSATDSAFSTQRGLR